MLVRDNGMMNDRLTVGGDPVHLSDITVPFLTVRANRDHIVPPDATAPLIDLVGSDGQARALPRRRAHGPGRRADGGEDDRADDHRLHPPPQRRRRRRRPREQGA